MDIVEHRELYGKDNVKVRFLHYIKCLHRIRYSSFLSIEGYRFWRCTSCSDHDGYESIASGLYMMSKADLLVGHNIIS